MKNGSIVLIVILAVVVLGAVWFGATYNSVVALGENVDAKWAQIENQLQRRYDLVPDLVKVANKYAAHEKDTIEAVVNARAKLSGASTVEDEIAASKELVGALSRLLVVVENYPTLKADA
ncbi:MAG: LemA family protein, partial [bacterium]|nr:LemA family protein [bacterium]